MFSFQEQCKTNHINVATVAVNKLNKVVCVAEWVARGHGKLTGRSEYSDDV